MTQTKTDADHHARVRYEKIRLTNRSPIMINPRDWSAKALAEEHEPIDDPMRASVRVLRHDRKTHLNIVCAEAEYAKTDREPITTAHGYLIKAETCDEELCDCATRVCENMAECDPYGRRAVWRNLAMRIWNQMNPEIVE